MLTDGTRRRSIRLAAATGGLVLMAMVLAAAADEAGNATRSSEQETAAELMVRAHQARAEWGDDFPGFRADIVVWQDDARTKGELVVTADGDVKLTFVRPPADENAIRRRLESLVMHRRSSGQREYDVEFADDQRSHPLGRLIRFTDDRLHSVYRIKNDVITEVHRTAGQTRFTISVIEVTRNQEKKYLPRTYTVSFWDAQTGALKTVSTTYNRWKRVGKFDLPAKVLSISTGRDNARTVNQIVLRNHKLLSSTDAAASGP